MGSRAGDRFNLRARPRLMLQHAEGLTLIDPKIEEASHINGVFLRAVRKKPEADGIGMTTYSGAASAVVLLSEFGGTMPGAGSQIERNGERWAIRNIEPIDEWAVKLHLSRPETETRSPARIRR